MDWVGDDEDGEVLVVANSREEAETLARDSNSVGLPENAEVMMTLALGEMPLEPQVIVGLSNKERSGDEIEGKRARVERAHDERVQAELVRARLAQTFDGTRKVFGEYAVHERTGLL